METTTMGCRVTDNRKSPALVVEPVTTLTKHFDAVVKANFIKQFTASLGTGIFRVTSRTSIQFYQKLLCFCLLIEIKAIPAELMQESLFFILSFFLISILIWEDDALGCQEDNLDVEPERPVLDIPDISADTLLHLP